MDIGDLANEARDVVRPDDAEGLRYELQSLETTAADEIGDPDSFPKYGEFLDVVMTDANGDALGPRWLECPAGLARSLVDLNIAAGDQFAVHTVEKTDDGAWTFGVSDRE
jgi:hypothetical protein